MINLKDINMGQHISITMSTPSEIDSSRFFKVYSSLSIDERKMTIVVIDEEPISWSMASNEIKNKTNLGKKILIELDQLEII